MVQGRGSSGRLALLVRRTHSLTAYLRRMIPIPETFVRAAIVSPPVLQYPAMESCRSCEL